MRLQKYIASAGITSRRKAEQWIADGRVIVNGEIVTEMGIQVTPGEDHVVVDGRVVTLQEEHVYYLLYKPIHVIASVSDPHGRRVVTDYLPKEPRVYPVGRLDFMTSGLILLTNDGDFTNYMIHPRHEVNKTYQVLVKGRPSPAALDRLRDGIELEGRKTKVALVENIVPKGNDLQFQMTIQEGRNRQVRRMCDVIEHPVIELKRIQMGSLQLGDLKPGEYRILTKNEIDALTAGR
jgi:23S rRNA pseudouridine2605 synthase